MGVPWIPGMGRARNELVRGLEHGSVAPRAAAAPRASQHPDAPSLLTLPCVSHLLRVSPPLPRHPLCHHTGSHGAKGQPCSHVRAAQLVAAGPGAPAVTSLAAKALVLRLVRTPRLPPPARASVAHTRCAWVPPAPRHPPTLLSIPLSLLLLLLLPLLLLLLLPCATAQPCSRACPNTEPPCPPPRRTRALPPDPLSPQDTTLAASRHDTAAAAAAE